jgi:hypothetical protein
LDGHSTADDEPTIIFKQSSLDDDASWIVIGPEALIETSSADTTAISTGLIHTEQSMLVDQSTSSSRCRLTGKGRVNSSWPSFAFEGLLDRLLHIKGVIRLRDEMMIRSSPLVYNKDIPETGSGRLAIPGICKDSILAVATSIGAVSLAVISPTRPKTPLASLYSID